MTSETFKAQYDGYQKQVEAYLEAYCKSQKQQGALQEAMAYSLLGGGKRLRPVLTLAICEMLGGKSEEALPFAAAVEMVHTYSLIHDDLPSMDNDDLRRGNPTCHKKFNEATAILAGDGLLTAAFRQIAAAPLSPDKVMAAVHCLSTLAGEQGMVGGQALEFDLKEKGGITLPQLQQIQSMKTGALLVAACNLGVIVVGGKKETFVNFTAYGSAIGRAFQIRDDILDATGTEAQLGKPIGSDEKEGTATFYSVLGEEKSQELVVSLTEEAKKSVSVFPRPEFLMELAQWLSDRNY